MQSLVTIFGFYAFCTLPSEAQMGFTNFMNRTITSEVYGVLNLSTGEQYLRIEQTGPDGTKTEIRFPLTEAADIALQTLYLLLNGTNGRAIAEQSPFYSEVKKAL